ncbi:MULTISPECIES: DUF6644 family protein [unclassified Novosphingobium]|uniref:DUF6644 family protein n=1 Tax=unclassified Novosphingobium TaxID=2644732 RepID=UPI0006B8AB91|nr:MULTISPECIES: DUF6644 family protein [unclassified Novosphingobium]KPF50538.1 hypothetical protein IP65_19730 [Novosphingobium sp. AAP1]PTR05264.1 hypothetical protein C8K11_1384 [Novosphingobium sp. GV055]PUA93838.1 hypothetical protein C8K12_1384 [Novosphingobium sp. GV061]PUB10925.1 hypothetical protein C8K14_1384 [Novosphingobium sp. GV079]PUB36489.1 hypothetical protein C8K10_1374 [Novosphingobium sp. GV027]
MTLHNTLQQIYDLPLSNAIRENVNAFPLLESLHVLAITLVFGSILIVDLRLVGYASHRRSTNRLITELLPFTWVAFGLAIISGGLLFASNAMAYAANTEFRLKLLMIAAAGINMAIFHISTQRTIDQWDEDATPPFAARAAGVLSLLLWSAVIFLGRWIGFTLDVLF